VPGFNFFAVGRPAVGFANYPASGSPVGPFMARDGIAFQIRTTLTFRLIPDCHQRVSRLIQTFEFPVGSERRRSVGSGAISVSS
jgi:hypothetical protein